jgi:hypothetical protein
MTLCTWARPTVEDGLAGSKRPSPLGLSAGGPNRGGEDGELPRNVLPMAMLEPREACTGGRMDGNLTGEGSQW